MKNLNDNELKNVYGGGFNFGVVAGIAAGIAFLIGVFDGIVRPLKCRY